LVVKVAKENVKIASNDVINTSKVPSHEASYKRAIRMLELSVEDIIEVEEDIFNQLVLDEWSWKNQFVNLTLLYKTGLTGR